MPTEKAKKPAKAGRPKGTTPPKKTTTVRLHHYLLDWNWDEDRCRVRTGHGPENMTRLRRFAIGLIKSKSDDSVAATIAKLARRVRSVFDYFRMTGKSSPRSCPSFGQQG